MWSVREQLLRIEPRLLTRLQKRGRHFTCIQLLGFVSVRVEEHRLRESRLPTEPLDERLPLGARPAVRGSW